MEEFAAIVLTHGMVSSTVGVVGGGPEVPHAAAAPVPRSKIARTATTPTTGAIPRVPNLLIPIRTAPKCSFWSLIRSILWTRAFRLGRLDRTAAAYPCHWSVAARTTFPGLAFPSDSPGRHEDTSGGTDPRYN